MKTRSGFSIVIILFIVALVGAIGGVVALSVYRVPEVPQAQNNSVPVGTQEEKTTNSDFPPLWDGVEWDVAVEDEYLFTDVDNNTHLLVGFRIGSETIEGYPHGFFDYYQDRLTGDGWIVAFAADGAGRSSVGFQKGGKFLTIEVNEFGTGSGPERTVEGYQLSLEYN